MRGLRYWLWRAYTVEVGATRMYALQSRARRGPLAERLEEFSHDEAEHAAALEDMMRRYSRTPGRVAMAVYRAAATMSGWLLAHLGRRAVMRIDYLLERSGITIYERLLHALPEDAAEDRERVRRFITQEEHHAVALGAWLAGVPVA